MRLNMTSTRPTETETIPETIAGKYAVIGPSTPAPCLAQ